MDAILQNQVLHAGEKLKSRQHVLMFSTGADSLASWLVMRKMGIDGVNLMAKKKSPARSKSKKSSRGGGRSSGRQGT